MHRGLAVIESLLILHPQATDEQLFHARVLGWCVEWLQAFFLVADDIMDESTTRRGQLCWYRKVGNNAVNDAFLLESCIYHLLKRHLKSSSCYVGVVELFHETSFQTELGQLVDLLVDKHDMDNYTWMVRYKTAYYSFYLPVALAMTLVGEEREEAFEYAKSILLPLGEYFQVQDDYLDCFGDPAVTGKIGTDIQDNKCSWLIVTAKERATLAQLALLKENYGRKDDSCVAAVKDMYTQLNLVEIYTEYEQASYDHILRLIQSDGLVPSRIFTAFMSKLYKRTK
jgi:farnesyl diphosphate synthase